MVFTIKFSYALKYFPIYFNLTVSVYQAHRNHDLNRFPGLKLWGLTELN